MGWLGTALGSWRGEPTITHELMAVTGEREENKNPRASPAVPVNLMGRGTARAPLLHPWGATGPESRGRTSPETGTLRHGAGVLGHGAGLRDLALCILSQPRRWRPCRCPEPSSAAALPPAPAARETRRVCGFLASCTLRYFCADLLGFDVTSASASSLPELRAEFPWPPGRRVRQPPPPAETLLSRLRGAGTTPLPSGFSAFLPLAALCWGGRCRQPPSPQSQSPHRRLGRGAGCRRGGLSISSAVPGRVGACWHLGLSSRSAATQTGQIGSAGGQEGWHGRGENCRTCRSGVRMENEKLPSSWLSPSHKSQPLGLLGWDLEAR